MSEEMKNQIAEEAVNEAEENFEQMLEDSIKTLYTGGQGYGHRDGDQFRRDQCGSWRETGRLYPCGGAER